MLPIPGDIHFYTELPIGVCIGPFIIGAILTALLAEALLRGSGLFDKPIVVVAVLGLGWVFAKVWMIVLAINWGFLLFWLMVVAGIPVGFFLIYVLWYFLGRELPLRISIWLLRWKIARSRARPIQVGRIRSTKLQQMSQAIRNRYFHGTSLQAAMDILKNNHVRMGVGNSLWLADLFNFARNHAKGRGFGQIGIVEFRLANGYQLNSKGGNVYTATIPGANPKKFYRFKSLTPVAVWDVNGNLIARVR